jgi:site-specific recombinase XerD
MKPKRLPLPPHPLTKFFLPTVESVTTSLGDASVTSYRGTVRLFLTYLSAHYPAVRSLDQLRRDPHILAWLAFLRSHNPPLATVTRANYVMYLRCMLDELAWTQQLPALAHLLARDDIPRKERHLPRPLTPEQDQLIQRELLRRDDLRSNALLLLRHTGMRIGECVDLSVDCLRPLGPNQWAIHVPLGKLKTERWVPVDSMVCQLVERILALRPPTAPHAGRLLLFRPRGRVMLIRRLRATLQDVAAAAGITARIVPHQFRHTYGTEMLRAGVGFAGVMQLLGHKSPHMTLQYLEITQQDLQREFHLARSHPRHLAPSRTLFLRPRRARIWPVDRLARSRPAPPGDVPPKRCRRFPTPSSCSPCQTSRQDPRRRQETQPASKIGKDWPVNAVSSSFLFGGFWFFCFTPCGASIAAAARRSWWKKFRGATASAL